MRLLLFETLTGKPVIDLEHTAWSSDTGILAADELKFDVPAYTKDAREVDLRALLVPRKYSVALVDESVAGKKLVPAAGVIVAALPSQDDDGNDLWQVTCYGPERVLEDWHIRAFPGWPLIGADGKPTGLYDMNFQNLEYGTIMKRLVQEGQKFPGGDLPIIFEPDRPGTREHAYQAINGKPVLDAMDDLADLINGVEYDFVPSITEDTDEVSWRLVTGTDAVREIVHADHLTWSLGGSAQDIRGYERAPVSGPTDSIFTGGKDSDSVLIARASDPVMLANGFPRREIWDSSHSSVSIQATLQGWADGALSGHHELIDFEVRAERAHGLRHGDKVLLDVSNFFDLPDEPRMMRVLAVSRSSSDPDWVGVRLV